MTTEERADKILRGCISPLCGLRYDEANTVRSELTQFFSEIKKRCKEECERRVTNYTVGGEYERGFNEAKNLCMAAIDRMEME